MVLKAGIRGHRHLAGQAYAPQEAGLRFYLKMAVTVVSLGPLKIQVIIIKINYFSVIKTHMYNLKFLKYKFIKIIITTYSLSMKLGFFIWLVFIDIECLSEYLESMFPSQ